MDQLMHKPGKPDAGFTLVELMVALTILSLVLVAVYSLLLNGTRMWYRGEEQVDVQQHLRVGMNFILRDIRKSAGVKADSSSSILKLLINNGPDIEYRLQGDNLVRDDGSSGLVASKLTGLEFQYQPDPPQPDAKVLVTVILLADQPSGEELKITSSARVRAP